MWRCVCGGEGGRLVKWSILSTPPPPPPPRLEAGAAANQASLAAPSASVHCGQMEARPHMLPHIRWQLEEGGQGVTGRCARPLLPRTTSSEQPPPPHSSPSAKSSTEDAPSPQSCWQLLVSRERLMSDQLPGPGPGRGGVLRGPRERAVGMHGHPTRSHTTDR